jgi:FG-GAP-like repeat
MRLTARWRVVAVCMLAAIVALAWRAWVASANKEAIVENAATPGDAKPQTPPDVAIASRDQVEQFCGACHAYPPPDSFPSANWPAEVARGFEFQRISGTERTAPSVRSVVAYYEAHAPKALPVLPRTSLNTRPPVEFRKREITGPRPGEPSAISYVGFAKLSDSARPGVLACEMAHNELLVLRGGQSEGPLTVLDDHLQHPAHVEVVDLDADGVNDLLVANLGAPMPTDDRRGEVVWLKGRKDGAYEIKLLAVGLGRVSDVQAADFDGDGDLDLVVAVFGWRRVGEILLLEQRRGPDNAVEFTRRTIDPRHGTIHVPVTDLNRDGKPDFVAVITQEYETVVAFLNTGGGQFTPRTLFKAPHPAFGCSGIQLTDLDADGKLDVLLTNGDVYDSPLLKPYHGVTWLRNQGDGPFEPRTLGALYGAQRALAGDIDGDGDLDVVATSFLGEPQYGAMRREVGADAVVLFEQTRPGEFVRHSIERETCDYASFALGDIDGDGDLDIIAGTFRDFRFANARPFDPAAPIPAPIVVFENVGRPRESVQSK